MTTLAGRPHLAAGRAGPDGARPRAGRWTRSWAPRPARRRSPGSSWRCGPRARRSRRCAAWPTRCSRTPAGSRCAGPSLDIVGTGGDRAHTVNISTMAVDRRRRRRASGWSSTATGRRRPPPGRRTCSRRSGSTSGLSPDRVAAVGARGGHHVLLRPDLPPVDAARRGRPGATSGIGTAFNFLGPLTNPAQPTYAAVGVADAADGAADRRASSPGGARTPWCSAATTASTSSPSRPRRRCGGCAAAQVHASTGSTPSDVGLSLSPLETLRGGDAAHNAGVVRTCWPARPGRSATRWCSTPASRWR